MKTFTVDATDANWEILGEACAFMLLPGLETRPYFVCRLSNARLAVAHASKIQGAYLNHEEACAFMLLPNLETKMTYIKAISNEQKGK